MFSGLFLLYSVKQKYNATVTSFIFRGINSSIGKLCSNRRSKTCWNYAEKKRRTTQPYQCCQVLTKQQFRTSLMQSWQHCNFLWENNFTSLPACDNYPWKYVVSSTIQRFWKPHLPIPWRNYASFSGFGFHDPNA